MTISQLNDRFGIAGKVHFDAGKGSLTRAILQCPQGEAHVYLHGAHVTHYQPRGDRPVLFTSGQSFFEPGKPIRGGIPICFPWFSNTHEPAHGFARLTEWQVQSSREQAGGVELTLTMAAEPHVSPYWPHKAALTYRVRLGDELEVVLEVKNLSQEAVGFEEALHTYLAVGDIHHVRLSGLQGTTFVAKSQGGQSLVQTEEPLTITQYIDRVYQNTAGPCLVEDAAWNRRIHVVKSGSDATVVWNPWVERAGAMPDFGNDEWPGMLCVESANVGTTTVQLAAGHTHRVTTTLRAEKST